MCGKIAMGFEGFGTLICGFWYGRKVWFVVKLCGCFLVVCVVQNGF